MRAGPLAWKTSFGFCYSGEPRAEAMMLGGPGDTRMFGTGSPGGKGMGLILLTECTLPRTSRLTTRILTTSFYDEYVASGRVITQGTREVLGGILDELGGLPVGVRSSATNESIATAGGRVSVRAGENTSFMLPNNHPDPAIRLRQMEKAVAFIYDDFTRKEPEGSQEQMAIVINPIPGVFDETRAGPVYYPLVSGVASSYFAHALRTQDPREGFARIAFGHGYATVLDDFPIVAMATIKNPLPVQFLDTGPGQKFFYALDMTRNHELVGQEMETMSRLHIRFAAFEKLRPLGVQQNLVTMDELVRSDRFGFRTGLGEIMEILSTRTGSPFQIEFVFNIDFATKSEDSGQFHVVQLTPLPEFVSGQVSMPDHPKRTYLSTSRTQGHGVKRGVGHAVVVSPFTYAKGMHDRVRRRIAEINRTMRGEGRPYLLFVPGRLGSRNEDWGIRVDFGDVDGAVAIFEYGVDIAGRAEPLPEKERTTGGIYGSHFLYMIQGGYSEDQKRLQTRIHGTQGTHFLTNLMSNSIVYAYLAPLEDHADLWLFGGSTWDDPVAVLPFPTPVSVYADSISQRCVVVEEE